MLILSLLLSFAKAEAYEVKTVKVSGYSQPWVMIKQDGVSPSSISHIRLHLHGWSQNPSTGAPQNPQYDFTWKFPNLEPSLTDYQKFIEAYGIQRDVERDPDHAVIIVSSRGHCDQYPELLKNFDQTFGLVLGLFNFSTEKAKLVHVSAHSGGGEVLSSLISDSRSRFFSQVQRATFYDAIYSESAKSRLATWLSKPMINETRRLEIPVIAGGSPFQWSQKLFLTFGTPEEKTTQKISGVPFKVRKKIAGITNVVLEFSESSSLKTLDHWSIVKHLWLFD